MRAVVLRWFKDRGFGFAEAEGGQICFVHVRDLKPPQAPEVGDRIEGSLLATERGPRIIKGRLLTGEPVTEGATSDEREPSSPRE